MIRTLLVAGVIMSGALMAAREQGLPTLTPAETKEGWKLLFDGKSLNGWQGYKGRARPPGGRPRTAILSREAAGGDLVTAEQFADFELRLEWKTHERAATAASCSASPTTATRRGTRGPSFRCSTTPATRTAPTR